MNDFKKRILTILINWTAVLMVIPNYHLRSYLKRIVRFHNEKNWPWNILWSYLEHF